jgi:hypothetical protein
MREAFETDKTRETAKAIQEFLTQFGRKRNKIAHTGSSGVVVNESELEQLLKFFRVFARGLCGLIETEIGTLIPK